ncbi:MAG: saccharopine dehydrogenase NADP-binding domain-containing protein [Saccharofermentans sp.]|nr:saccharopine dehydrogenase NADP-binding domain-containing protein [Saccharofermentans sp.]
MKRVLILGCNEITKRLLITLCEYQDLVSGICLAAKERKDCDELKDLAASKGVRITTAGIDVNNVEGAMMMVKIFAPDIIVNLLPSELTIGAMNLALKAKADYIDANLAGVQDIPSISSLLSEQFSMFSEFQKNNKTAVCGTGFVPGVVNTIIRRAITHDFKKIESVDIVSLPEDKKAKGRARKKAEIDGTLYYEDVKPSSNSSLSSFLNKIDPTNKVFYIEDGTVVEADRYSVEAKSSSGNAVYLVSDIILTDILKEMPEVPNARFFKISKKAKVEHVAPEKKIQLLSELGLLSTEPVKVGDAMIAPIDLMEAVLPKMADSVSDTEEIEENVSGIASYEIYITGIDNDGNEAVKSYIIKGDNDLAYEKYEVNAFEEMKGTALIAGVKMMCSDKWNKPGVFTPVAFDCDEYFDAFTAEGIAVTEGDKKPF